MSIRYSGPEARLHAAEVFRQKWLWLVLLGVVLIVAGAVAMVIPAVSGVPANEVLGSVLMVSGFVQIMQAAKMLNWEGFIWHMLLGIVAAIGGALISLDPFPGIVTITILIAIIFAVHGATQIVFAWKVRRQTGWHWFLVSGCVALIVSVLLLMKLPYGHSFTPATVAGVSLIFGGWAYVAMALASRRSDPPSI
ncbi:MAG: HdeD family acid-resistance protein [Alphaproteobacteria bacterium]|jgi:uncharacterized membrane protein HdeD (DUF308 family)|nr:HdeD family acid-resistance protein [Alphaproteobacteria bacterium]